LAELPGFTAAAGAADLSGDPGTLVAELAELFAGVFLANARDVRSLIVFVHAVTAVHALGNIAPHVAEPTVRALARHAWRTACGLYAAYGGGGLATEPAAAGDPRALAERAVASGGEHEIKFAEACLARHKIAPSPVYLAAIGHALGLMPRR
jgi:hypothetical protein